MDRDNQQVRDIAWLSGIIDGEGCIHLEKKKQGKNTAFIPTVTIKNTNWLIIENIDRILKENKIGHYIYSEKSSRRPIWGIRITGTFRCKSLLIVVLPYLYGKSKEANILHKHICSRLSKPRNQPYTEDEKRTYEVLRMLKTMPNPNDYTLDIFTEKMKIESGLHGNM